MWVFLWMVLLMVNGCSLGPLRVEETHYYAVSNGTNTNSYRLDIRAASFLGDAGYRSGWFPAHAIDSLFGDTTAQGGLAALETRSKLEQQINYKLVSTNQAWLEYASQWDAKNDKLKGLLMARKRVLGYPRTQDPFKPPQ